MRAPLSIIIPTLNAADGLAVVLGALGDGLEVGLIRELVVSDGGSDDGTVALAQGAGAEVVVGVAGRGGQLARGADAAQGAWLLFLHGDTVLGDGWAGAVLAHMGEGPDRAGYFRLGFRAEGVAPRIVAGWANLRARWFGLPYGDQGLLISRDLYDAVGGFADMPLMEDVAMARALRRKMRMLGATAFTSAERYQRQGWLRRGARNLLTLARYLMGASSEKLARAYRR